jgi:hypothetical protein
MAFKTFAPGVLTSSDVNTFLMRQAVIVCTSTTRPASPNEGMTIYETDNDRVLTYSGTSWNVGYQIGAWRSFTPTVRNAGSGTDWVLGNGTLDCKFQQVGSIVAVRYDFIIGSTTTKGTKGLAFDLPVNRTASVSGVAKRIGQAAAIDTSTAFVYTGVVNLSVAAQWAVFGFVGSSGAPPTESQMTSTQPMTWDTGDTLTATAIYEAA